MKQFRKIMASLMSFVMLIFATVVPIQSAWARADAATIAASPTRGQYNPTWYTRYVDPFSKVTPVSVPRHDWRLLATLKQGGWNESDKRMMQGEAWVSQGLEAVGQLGLEPQQLVSAFLADTVGTQPWVVARYFPERAQLRIDVFKITRDAQGTIRIAVAPFTPHDGEHWRLNRRYLTESERRYSPKAGYNPFEAFRGYDDDPTFHNISIGAAQVAIAHAMQDQKSIFGLFSVTNTRFTQEQRESGNFLRKTVTTITKGYVQPTFYLAMPVNMSPQRNDPTPSAWGVICATGASVCDDEKHVVLSGIALEPLRGGNIPTGPAWEEQAYYNATSSSSWTGVAFTLFTAALTYASAGAYGLAAGGIGAGGAAAGSLTAAELAAAAGTAYAGGTLAINGGPITEVQSGWMASVGWTPSGVGNGVSTGANCANAHCNGLYSAVTVRHITTDPLNSNNLNGWNKITQGNCPQNMSTEACRAAGMDPGVTMPRSDSYIEAKSVMIMKERERQCKARGLTGQVMRQCIAPPMNDPNHPND